MQVLALVENAASQQAFILRSHFRSRSRSPGESRSSRSHASQLPEELLRHVEFGLVEPSGDDDVRLRGEIPFTNVETTRSTLAGRPVMSAASATTRSINRLHTKPRNNYRPPPPPPSSSTTSHARHNNGDYSANMNKSETHSEVSANVGRQTHAKYITSAPYNVISSSPNVYNQSKQHHLQQVSRPNESLDAQYYHNQQQQQTAQPSYHPHQLPPNYNDNNFQQNPTQPNMFNKQLNPLQHAPLISSVSSSPNMMKATSGMNIPSPIVSSSANPYAKSTHLEYNNTGNGAYLNTSTQQNNQYFQHAANRIPVTQNHASSYYPNSSSQASRVYTVNQPRASPHQVANHFPGATSPVNSSTPITRHQAPHHYSQQINSNGYNGGTKSNPAYQHQSHLQGKSDVMQGSGFPTSNMVGLPGQISRTPSSYQSPYSTNTPSNLNQQQPYSSNRSSRERLDANVAMSSPQTLPASNMSIPNGKIQPTIYGQGTQSQNTNNMYYNDISGVGKVPSAHEQRQTTAKGNYALPVSIREVIPSRKPLLNPNIFKIANYKD